MKRGRRPTGPQRQAARRRPGGSTHGANLAVGLAFARQLGDSASEHSIRQQIREEGAKGRRRRRPGRR